MRLGVAKKINRNAININTIDVFILIGDSTQEGAGGTIVPSPPYDALMTDALIYFKPDITATDNGSWATYQFVTNDKPGRNDGYNGSAPSPFFMYQMNTLKTRQFAVIKVAKGGTSLNGWSKGTNQWYQTFLNNFYSVCLPKLVALGYVPVIKAINVRLGTNDTATEGNTTNFKSRLETFTSDIRADIGLPLVPFYWYQVRSDLTNDALYIPANRTIIRDILVNASTEGHAYRISNFNLINVDGTTADFEDGVHFTAAVNQTQGIALANLLSTL